MHMDWQGPINILAGSMAAIVNTGPFPPESPEADWLGMGIPLTIRGVCAWKTVASVTVVILVVNQGVPGGGGFTQIGPQWSTSVSGIQQGVTEFRVQDPVGSLTGYTLRGRATGGASASSAMWISLDIGPEQ